MLIVKGGISDVWIISIYSIWDFSALNCAILRDIFQVFILVDSGLNPDVCASHRWKGPRTLCASGSEELPPCQRRCILSTETFHCFPCPALPIFVQSKKKKRIESETSATTRGKYTKWNKSRLNKPGCRRNYIK